MKKRGNHQIPKLDKKEAKEVKFLLIRVSRVRDPDRALKALFSMTDKMSTGDGVFLFHRKVCPVKQRMLCEDSFLCCRNAYFSEIFRENRRFTGRGIGCIISLVTER